jgi:hypothetical protein
MPGSIAATKDKAEHVRFALILRLKLPIRDIASPATDQRICWNALLFVSLASWPGKTRPSLKSGQGFVMRTKIAFAVLFAAWFWSQAQAQWERPPYPPPPPPLLDQSEIYKPDRPQRPLKRPVKTEPTRPTQSRSIKPGDWQGTAEEQKLRKEIRIRNKKSTGKRQKTNKAAATGSATSSSTAGTKTPTKPAASTSAGTKAPSKPSSRRKDRKETTQGAESASRDTRPIQHENDLLKISIDAAKNPAVVAFRNCIGSYFARGMERGIDRTWADLLTRATEGECRAQFDEMAQILSKRFGEKRVEQVMQQLIQTTLLPAAKAGARGDTGVSVIPPQ